MSSKSGLGRLRSMVVGCAALLSLTLAAPAQAFFWPPADSEPFPEVKVTRTCGSVKVAMQGPLPRDVRYYASFGSTASSRGLVPAGTQFSNTLRRNVADSTSEYLQVRVYFYWASDQATAYERTWTVGPCIVKSSWPKKIKPGMRYQEAKAVCAYQGKKVHKKKGKALKRAKRNKKKSVYKCVQR